MVPSITRENDASIWSPVLVHEDPFATRHQLCLNVIARIRYVIVLATVTNFKINNITHGAIHEVMCRSACVKSRAIAWPQLGFPSVCNERWLAFEDVNKLILLAVTVEQR